MSRAAITVENLSKAYHIGLKEDRADTLVGALHGLVRAPVRNFRRLARMNTFKHCGEAEDIFWALKDVSFEVAEGEVVGIIGRNGAGKSTLLKILSRITEPTTGRAVIRGRVSSLLEVGTGFHPELTGRENVYMNGTILGMTKREIDRKFDEIVDFSGVERFLDTPIKHYSSGMKVRLAFAVAAHLEPEILIIDEVLAVGDLEFQNRCLGKMKEVAGSGRTVLFVSHNLTAVRSLCTSGIVLDRGRLSVVASTDESIHKYEELTVGRASVDLANRKDREGDGSARVTHITFHNCEDRPIESIAMGQSMVIRLCIRSSRRVENPHYGILLFNSTGQRLCRLLASDHQVVLPPLEVGINWIDCETDLLPFAPGVYSLTIGVHDDARHALDHVHDAARFTITASDVFGSNQVPCHGDIVFLWSKWSSSNAMTSSAMAN